MDKARDDGGNQGQFADEKEAGSVYNHASVSYTHLDVYKRQAFAMEQICRHFGIDAQHVLAFGDNENDMDMLRHAGVSVAMGNANREVQQVATMVTSSNKEGGVAAALQSLIF